MSASLDGKVAVVTGGGTGIGAAAAVCLAKEGCRIVVSGRRVDVIEKVAKDVSGLAVAADVANEDDVIGMFKACDDAYGRLDILVNNAGFGGGGVMGAADIDMEAWDRTFAVNVRGVMLCTKHAIPLLKRHGGTIVNVASIAGIKPNMRQIPYGASKAAVISLTRSVADEVGALGIRVNALCPGAVDTPLFRGNAAERVARTGGKVEDDVERIAALSSLGRLTTCEEVASGILFLATEASGSMTGTRLVMDAGKV
jgi:NAD(P)-dependent dehydrogenase (short-subunit alcohol dehydrogenase family)